MRDFIWNVFSMTGDVESYLLYKEVDESKQDEDWAGEEQEDGLDLTM
jgi:hypothetical protein